MISVSYVSNSCINGDIAKILELQRECNSRNERSGVTGCLYTDSVFFFQILEGDRVPVLSTLRRICRDTRHKDIQIINGTNIEERVFSNWAMKLVNGISNPYLSRVFDRARFLNADRMFIEARTDDLLRI